MEEFIDHIMYKYGKDIFILFPCPVIGMILQTYLSRKAILYFLGGLFIFLIPVFTNYQYAIPYAFHVLGFLWFSFAYALFSGFLKKDFIKVALATLASAGLFVVLGFAAFLSAFDGYETVQHTWKHNEYKVEYVMYSGFSGRPSFSYHISEYTPIPLFITELEKVYVEDTSRNCMITFRSASLVFNKCNGEFNKSDTLGK